MITFFTVRTIFLLRKTHVNYFSKHNYFFVFSIFQYFPIFPKNYRQTLFQKMKYSWNIFLKLWICLVNWLNEARRRIWLSSHNNFSFLSRKTRFCWIDFRCNFFLKMSILSFLSLVFLCTVHKYSTLHENHVKRYFVILKSGKCYKIF